MDRDEYPCPNGRERQQNIVRHRALGYLRSQIPWKSLSSQQMDLGAELLNFWCGEDELDWGYSQYFEIAAGNLKPFLAMTLFTEILCKHFPDVMSAPVKRLSNKL